MLEGFRNKMASAISPKSADATGPAMAAEPPIKIMSAGSDDMDVVTKDIASITQAVSAVLGQNKIDPPRLGVREVLQVYSRAPWLRGIVNKLGKAVGDTDWRLYYHIDKKQPGKKAVYNPRPLRMATMTRKAYIKSAEKKDEIVEAVDHPLLDLLDYGNQAMMGKTVLQLTSQHLDLVGEAFWYMDMDAMGIPRAIYPLAPHWVKDTPKPDQPYFIVNMNNSAQLQIEAKCVVWFKEVDPYDPYGRGSGIAKSLGDEIETDEFASKHTKSFFFNRARPDLVISGDSIQPADVSRLETKWNEKLRGVFNSYRPYFFSKKVEVKEIGQTFENMQMVDLRTRMRDTVMQTYGIPPEKLGVIGESKRSTIANADLFWTKDLVTPRAELIRATIQRVIIPLFDKRLVLDFDSPVLEDRDFKLNVMKAATWAFTINDYRRLCDLDSLGDEGDVLLLPLNEQPTPVTIPDNTVSGALEIEGLSREETAVLTKLAQAIAEGGGLDPATKARAGAVVVKVTQLAAHRKAVADAARAAGDKGAATAA